MPKEAKKRRRSSSSAGADREQSAHSASKSKRHHKRRRDDRDVSLGDDKEREQRPETAERLGEPKDSSTKEETSTSKKDASSTTQPQTSVKRRRASSDSDSSSDNRHTKRKKKKSKKHKRGSERKHKERKRKKKKRKRSSPSPEIKLPNTDHESQIGPVPNPEQAKAVMAPMTKAEWEQQQSVVRRVYDPESGRQRLVKGDGEIIEEIVSLKRHKEINKQATAGDGTFFQQQLLSKNT